MAGNNRIDLEGKRFGMLIALKYSHTERKRAMWLCQCDCGVKKCVRSAYLLNGDTTSCRCYRRNRRKHEPHISTAAIIFSNRYSDSDLTFEQFLEMSQKNCHYCGAPPSNKTNPYKHNPNKPRWEEYWWEWNGLDRIDNTRAHTLDNVVPCCPQCNYGRNDYSVNEFLEWIDRVYHHIHRSMPESAQDAEIFQPNDGITISAQSGDDHYRAKLNADKVKTIRQLSNEGEKPVEIAKLFGVSNSLIAQIIRGEIWKQVK